MIKRMKLNLNHSLGVNFSTVVRGLKIRPISAKKSRDAQMKFAEFSSDLVRRTTNNSINQYY